jgi:hypothetical protein
MDITEVAAALAAQAEDEAGTRGAVVALASALGREAARAGLDASAVVALALRCYRLAVRR